MLPVSSSLATPANFTDAASAQLRGSFPVQVLLRVTVVISLLTHQEEETETRNYNITETGQEGAGGRGLRKSEALCAKLTPDKNDPPSWASTPPPGKEGPHLHFQHPEDKG